MLVKYFEVTLKITSPMTFCSNVDVNIMTELRRLYEGKCYQGAFIMKVLEVPNRGPCNIITSNLKAHGSIDVHFKAHVVILGEWDILTGVEITSNSQIVHGRCKIEDDGYVAPISVIIDKAANAPIDSLKVGQIVSVRVIRFSHEPMCAEINAVGCLYVCESRQAVFDVVGKVDKTCKAEIAGVLACINIELEKRVDLQKIDTVAQNIVFIEQKINCTRTTKVLKKDSWQGEMQEGSNDINILQIAGRIVDSGEAVDFTGHWTRLPAINRTSPFVSKVSALDKVGAVAASPKLVILFFLKNILDSLVAVRQMAEIYKTPDIKKAHANIWLIMEAAQTK